MSQENGYISPWIPDGYQREETIPESPGRWSAVRIRFRPLSIDEESSIYARQRLSPNEPLARFYAEVFAGTPPNKGNLLDWDLKDHQGHKLMVTAQNIRQLDPAFFDALKAVIEGSVRLSSGETKAEAEVKNS